MLDIGREQTGTERISQIRKELDLDRRLQAGSYFLVEERLSSKMS